MRTTNSKVEGLTSSTFRLRFVFFHSLALAVLAGIFVFLQAYVYPFTALVY